MKNIFSLFMYVRATSRPVDESITRTRVPKMKHVVLILSILGLSLTLFGEDSRRTMTRLGTLGFQGCQDTLQKVAQNTSDTQLGGYDVRGLISSKTQVFHTTRNLNIYRKRLGGSFDADLDNMHEDLHWLDLGTGDGVALSVYSGEARITGITYQYNGIPTKEFLSRRARILKGRYFEEIPLEEIGRADLITDLYGVFAYTSQVDVVTSRALELLTEGGRLYIYLGDYNELDLTSIQAGSQKLKFSEWLSTIPGIGVRVLKDGTRPYFVKDQPKIVRITMYNNELVRVPKLRTIAPNIKFQDSPVPIRSYAEEN